MNNYLQICISPIIFIYFKTALTAYDKALIIP